MVSAAATSAEYAAFLRETLPVQQGGMKRHRFKDETVWLKKAGPRNPRWGYALLGLVAGLLRLDVLRPVMNLGGPEAIRHEARRLRELAALGLRVPAVLAEQEDGLLLADLGTPDIEVDTMLGHVSIAADRHGPDETLKQWQRGLDAIALVHARGSYLSQAFARNLVSCPDGVVGYIDFEDDPGASLTLAQCQARDWLSYVQSTAVYLLEAGALAGAHARWQTMLRTQAPDVRASLNRTARRMGWLRRLPQGRRWGRDTARLRAAALFFMEAGPPS